MSEINQELTYLILFSAVLLLPKVLKRWHLPEGMTCLFLGVLSSFFWETFESDQLLLLLSRLGITSLFLFAGLEVDVDSLKKNAMPITKQIGIDIILITFVGLFLGYLFNLSERVGIILALGLLTPSTGFILDSLGDYKIHHNQKYWIRSKSIAEEILAVFILFFAMQSENLQQLTVSVSVLLAMLFSLPLIFRFFLKWIAPHAPNSELAFLVLIALISGVITKKLGTYYLVGAFLVGIIAGRFKHFMGHTDGKQKEDPKIFTSLSHFFGIFIPFYFFKAGLSFSKDTLTKEGVLIGLGFCVFLMPMRYFAVQYSQKNFVEHKDKRLWKIALSLLPTLIFGLVIASILKEKYQVDNSIITGLFIYTIATSIMPTIAFERKPPQKLDTGTINEGKDKDEES